MVLIDYTLLILVAKLESPHTGYPYWTFSGSTVGSCFCFAAILGPRAIGSLEFAIRIDRVVLGEVLGGIGLNPGHYWIRSVYVLPVSRPDLVHPCRAHSPDSHACLITVHM